MDPLRRAVGRVAWLGIADLDQLERLAQGDCRSPLLAASRPLYRGHAAGVSSPAGAAFRFHFFSLFGFCQLPFSRLTVGRMDVFYTLDIEHYIESIGRVYTVQMLFVEKKYGCTPLDSRSVD